MVFASIRHSTYRALTTDLNKYVIICDVERDKRTRNIIDAQMDFHKISKQPSSVQRTLGTALFMEQLETAVMIVALFYRLPSNHSLR